MQSSVEQSVALAQITTTVGQLDLTQGPRARIADGLDHARSVAATWGHGWLGLVDDQGCFAGWVPEAALAGATSLDDLTPEPPAARVRSESTLREALEVILTASTPPAVVERADGTFEGLVQLEGIRQGLTG